MTDISKMSGEELLNLSGFGYPKMSGSDLLLLLAPPLSLIDKLDAAPTLPAEIAEWVQRWKAIRSDGPSEIDQVTQEVYQQALIVVEEKVKKKAKAY